MRTYKCNSHKNLSKCMVWGLFGVFFFSYRIYSAFGGRSKFVIHPCEATIKSQFKEYFFLLINHALIFFEIYQFSNTFRSADWIERRLNRRTCYNR